MTSTYERELGRELAAVGIGGSLRCRILAEIADHLACDPQASLGEPAALARQFADELGTARALTAAVGAFAALVFAGTLFAVAFLLSGRGAFGAAPPGAPLIGRIATGVALFAPQLAFVAGGLAALRWWRRRRERVLPAAEARVIVRRALVGIVAGIATMASLGTIAIVYSAYVSPAWRTFTLVGSALGTVALGAALPWVRRAIALRPLAEGGPGDLLDDLGPLAPASLRGRPWRLALLVAAVIAALITVAGVAASDPYDGAVRGVMDALLCLGGFATLGRWLGLWSPAGRRSPGD